MEQAQVKSVNRKKSLDNLKPVRQEKTEQTIEKEIKPKITLNVSEIHYEPIISATKKIESNKSFGELTKFLKNFFSLSIGRSGQFYEDYGLSSNAKMHRNRYYIYNEHFISYLRPVLDNVASIMKTLNDTDRARFIFDMAINLENEIKNYSRDYSNNIKENYGNLNQLLSEFHLKLIANNGELITNYINDERSSVFSKTLRLWTLANENVLIDVLNTFTKLKDRTIFNCSPIYCDKMDAPYSFDTLLENLSGWDSPQATHWIIDEFQKTDIPLIRKMVEKIHYKEYPEIFEKHIKKIFYKNIPLYKAKFAIETFYGGFTKNNVFNILNNLERAGYSTSDLNNANINFREVFSTIDFKEIKGKPILFIISEKIPVIFKEEERFQNFEHFYKEVNDSKYSFMTKFFKMYGKENFIKDIVRIANYDKDAVRYAVKSNSFLNDEEWKTCLENILTDKSLGAVAKNEIIFSFIDYLDGFSKRNKEFINRLFKDLGFFQDLNKGIELVQSIKNSISGQTKKNLIREIIYHFGIWNIVDNLLQLSNHTLTSANQKRNFIFIIDELNELSRDDFLKPHYFKVSSNPITTLLDRVNALYEMEKNSVLSLTSTDLDLNEELWQSLGHFIEKIESILGLELLRQLDNNEVSIKTKIDNLSEIIVFRSNSNVRAIRTYGYSPNKEQSLSNKLMFWKKEERLEQFEYLYISPTGTMLSNELIPEFVTVEETIEKSWKEIHDEDSATIHKLMQLENISAEVRIFVRDMIHSFRNDCEKIEEIKSQLSFEENMFFETSYFKDLKEILTTYSKSVKTINQVGKLKDIDQTEVLETRKNDCLRILNLLKDQSEKITFDIFNTLIIGHEMELKTMGEYIKSRNISRA